MTSDYETDFFLKLNAVEKDLRDDASRASVSLLREIVPIFERWYEKQANSDIHPDHILIGTANAVTLLVASVLSRDIKDLATWPEVAQVLVNAHRDKLLDCGVILRAMKKERQP